MSQTVCASGNDIFSGLLTADQLAAQFNVCARTLARRRKEGMPHMKVGATVLFDPTQVRDWIMAQAVRPAEPKRGRPRRA